MHARGQDTLTLLLVLFVVGCGDGARTLDVVDEASATVVELRQPYLAKIWTTPDFLQTDPAFGEAQDGGQMYCGPVSVSNSLIWLDQHGFESLVPSSGDQFDLILELTRRRYLDTDLATGTSAANVLKGVERYVTDRGLSPRRVKFQGWRAHGASYSTGVDIPGRDWIKKGVRGKSAVWLNVGWYRYNGTKDKYRRVGGHWVTVVGYGFDGQTADERYLILHDPSPRAGASFANEYVRTRVIQSGRLVGDYSGLPRSAVGYLQLKRGMHLHPDADAAIVDGAVVLKM